MDGYVFKGGGGEFGVEPSWMSVRELQELLAAWLILSLAFAVLYGEGDTAVLVQLLPACLFSVGLGFVLHELGHKVYAQRFGLEAVFHANFQGLAMAVLVAFAGFIFVSPGAVGIRGRSLSRRENGVIALLGPVMNVVLAVAFLLVLVSPVELGRLAVVTAFIGFRTNVWLGLFNLIPSHPFDGAAILAWNKLVYGVLVVVTAGLFLYSRL